MKMRRWCLTFVFGCLVNPAVSVAREPSGKLPPATPKKQDAKADLNEDGIVDAFEREAAKRIYQQRRKKLHASNELDANEASNHEPSASNENHRAHAKKGARPDPKPNGQSAGRGSGAPSVKTPRGNSAGHR